MQIARASCSASLGATVMQIRQGAARTLDFLCGGSRAWSGRFALLSAIGLLSGCPHLQLVAEYDAKTYEETIRVGKSVDLFYAKLIELPPEKRGYAPYAEQYAEIESDIRSLVRRNAARPLNEESRKICETILKFWSQYRDKHKKLNAYPDARFDRDRMSRLFTAAAAAEEAKKLPADDRSPEKE